MRPTCHKTYLHQQFSQKGDTDCVDGEVAVDIPSGRATLRLLPGRTLKQLRTVLGPAIKEHKVRGRLLGSRDWEASGSFWGVRQGLHSLV